MTKGLVFNIQRYTLHDGPGIRTEVFLKGCPLSCRWCSNPESQCVLREVGVYSSKCIGKGACGACERSCPIDSCIGFHSDGRISGVNRDTCISCMRCAGSCPSGALKAWGEKMTVEEVMAEVRKDLQFYESSGGGITVSGGEPMLQADFTAALLCECKKEGISTCVESTFYTGWKTAEKVLEYCDVVISDLKLMNDRNHRRYTGVSVRPILKNLRRLSQAGRELILRIPLIPGVNDSDENINRTIDYVNQDLEGRIKHMQILEFMHLGEEKCASLGRTYPMKGYVTDRDSLHERALEIKDRFIRNGIECIVGNE